MCWMEVSCRATIWWVSWSLWCCCLTSGRDFPGYWCWTQADSCWFRCSRWQMNSNIWLRLHYSRQGKGLCFNSSKARGFSSSFCCSFQSLLIHQSNQIQLKSNRPVPLSSTSYTSAFTTEVELFSGDCPLQFSQPKVEYINIALLSVEKKMMEPLFSWENQLSSETLWVTLVIVLLLLCRRRIRVNNRRRLTAVRNRLQPCIPQDQVIVALELEDLFVHVAHQKRQNYCKIRLENSGIAHLLARVKELFNFGIYYRPLLPIRKMRSLLSSLQNHPKIQLYLYTRLSKEVATEILTQTGLSPFFPQECRRSSFEPYNQSLKHPTEVDFNTKRVVIVTNARQDYFQDYSKYFWLARKGEVAESLRLLATVISNNQDIDELHNELTEIKVAIEGEEEEEGESEEHSIC